VASLSLSSLITIIVGTSRFQKAFNGYQQNIGSIHATSRDIVNQGFLPSLRTYKGRWSLGREVTFSFVGQISTITKGTMFIWEVFFYDYLINFHMKNIILYFLGPQSEIEIYYGQ
jgi:hypothetical protein